MQTEVTQADGHAKRKAALDMVTAFRPQPCASEGSKCPFSVLRVRPARAPTSAITVTATMKGSAWCRHRSEAHAEPPHRLHGLDHRRQAPARHQVGDLPGEPLDAGLGIGHGMDMILQHNLLRRVREPHRRQPAAIGLRPALLPGIDPAVPQEEALQVLARLACDPHRRRTCPDQIAHRLVRRVGAPPVRG
ncbi:hypothetical protein D0Z66_16590 [Cereibacter sphaeroides]|nr:hypothetical protein D0Z66_16590 [Cereibacter sphaeroides]